MLEEINLVKAEILKLGKIPLRFEINDKVIDSRNQLDDLQKQLKYWQQQLDQSTGVSPVQGPDREIY